ncbi:MAG: extracellular solute-binding protein [Deltaproteobacteria bacterium]|nr:extracellular solute-binding protein [Deltaproteobacteria bacterium]
MTHRLTVFLCILAGIIIRVDGVHGDPLVENARKEGSVVFYTNVPQEQITRLSDAFEKKYPFLKVQGLRAGPSRLLSRVMTEERAGRPLVDVISLDTFNAWVLREGGFLQVYKSQEIEAFPEQFRDPDGLMPCCMYVLTNEIAYNTKLVAKKDVPKSYRDLLDPKWAGKMGMDNDDAKWFAPLVSIWGKEKTVDYFRALMKQNPSMVRGHTLQTELLAAGEFSLAVNVFGYQALEVQSRGAPIEIVQADPVIARAGHLLLAKRAPHPNAGRLFIDYVLSAEGQQLLAKMGRIVARRGVNIKFPRLVQGVKLHPVKPEMAKNFEELSKLYSSIVK